MADAISLGHVGYLGQVVKVAREGAGRSPEATAAEQTALRTGARLRMQQRIAAAEERKAKRAAAAPPPQEAGIGGKGLLIGGIAAAVLAIIALAMRKRSSGVSGLDDVRACVRGGARSECFPRFDRAVDRARQLSQQHRHASVVMDGRTRVECQRGSCHDLGFFPFAVAAAARKAAEAKKARASSGPASG